MKWTVLIAALVAALSNFSTAPVLANDVADVVRARANARAGGGTSGHDAWVLKRHGKLSGTRSRSRRTLAKKKAVKKRALLAAKARKSAAAKRRARIAAAKKKKAAQRRALLLAKKKAAKKRSYALYQKRKAAEKQAKLVALASQKKANQLLAAQASDNVETPKKESSFVSAPSTATLMTSQDLATNPLESVPNSVLPTNVAVAKMVQEKATEPTTTTESLNVGDSNQASDGNCKRFLPAIGLTISVGC